MHVCMRELRAFRHVDERHRKDATYDCGDSASYARRPGTGLAAAHLGPLPWVRLLLCILPAPSSAFDVPFHPRTTRMRILDVSKVRLASTDESSFANSSTRSIASSPVWSCDLLSKDSDSFIAISSGGIDGIDRCGSCGSGAAFQRHFRHRTTPSTCFKAREGRKTMALAGFLR